MEAQGEGLTVAATEAPGAPRLPVFGHEPLSGHYRTRLETNGRIVVPSALRSPFVAAAQAHVLPRSAGTLWLLTPRAFDALVDHLHADAKGLADPRMRSRLYMAAPKISIDRQARLVVPPEMREKAGLHGEAEIVLAGAIEHIELWPADVWDEHEAPRLADSDLSFEGFEGLPTGPA